MKNIILASTSTIHGSDFLEYLLDDLEDLFGAIDEVLFIPYARPNGVSHDDYTNKAQEAFTKIGLTLHGIHEHQDPQTALANAKGIFVGGGNTFVLVKALYEKGLMPILKERIISGMPYLGTSAGSNICGLSLGTTNDMPIVYPPSFSTLGVVPFNINPHYLDPDPKSTHMGETRETRIKEFHKFNDTTVIGLREGSFLRVWNNSIVLNGDLNARIFEPDEPAREVKTGTDLKIYLNK
ncbi:MAG: dipeptidase PepE [Bacteroidia bacterium]|nr:dipeptidase PepE [Bacteroidia bacterium]MBT8279518.1 dipeptidase PepE [Bacteroidia bacterium]NND26059.1 dipeptidase PepE [Flavobacteriaceae bacterium]NNK61009.1 dipeptidase PepE [Flavobacteriaceae bacterium]NNL33597.1 dipeptidase PepE [Flavobacteriaceae bacterium]